MTLSEPVKIFSAEDERISHALFLGLSETAVWEEINAAYNEMGRQAEEAEQLSLAEAVRYRLAARWK